MKAMFSSKYLYENLKSLVPNALKIRLIAVRAKYREDHAWKNYRKSIQRVHIFPDDIFLVSYPKSGNTWLRFLVANLISPETKGVSFTDIQYMVPDIYVMSQDELSVLKRPRIIKSHECYTNRYPRVIYIIRDPRDVAVSFYHYMIKANEIDENTSMQDWFPGFLKGKHHSDYGNWNRNVSSWLKQADKNRGHLLIIKYEDLLKEPLRVMNNISDFLDLSINQQVLEQSIEMSSADHMRRKEMQEKPFKGMRNDKPFVRSAQSGGWKTELSPELASKIEMVWEKTMEALGYLGE